jgi:hypothetical protein
MRTAHRRAFRPALVGPTGEYPWPAAPADGSSSRDVTYRPLTGTGAKPRWKCGCAGLQPNERQRSGKSCLPEAERTARPTLRSSRVSSPETRGSCQSPTRSLLPAAHAVSTPRFSGHSYDDAAVTCGQTNTPSRPWTPPLAILVSHDEPSSTTHLCCRYRNAGGSSSPGSPNDEADI